MNIKQELENVIEANHPLTLVYTQEEQKVKDILSELRESEAFALFFYDAVQGLRTKDVKTLLKSNLLDDKRLLLRLNNAAESSPLGSVKEIAANFELLSEVSSHIKTVLAICGAETLLKDPVLVRLMKNFIEESGSVSVILLSSELFVPSQLEVDTHVIELSRPDMNEVSRIIDEFCDEQEISIESSLKNKFLKALLGLSYSEIENLLYLAFMRNYKLDEEDVAFFLTYKKQITKKGGVLEFVDTEFISSSELGGLREFKKWLSRKGKVMSRLEEAVKRGVDVPKGVLLFGMPGCGKSLAAKVAAKQMGLPLLRLDMGRVMGRYLGESEENLRKAISIAEALAPSILWIDELEKALGGLKSAEGGGTGSRILATLLTWMQEKTKPVFVIATANDVSGIPPEFMRKGRFDEVFFVDFPKESEIEEILKIHMKKRKRESDIGKIDAKKLAREMKRRGFSGADVEAVVSEAVERAFVEGRDISYGLFNEIMKEIKSTKEVLGKKIEELEKLRKNLNAKAAN